jgi:hypothetical protein
MSPQYSAEVLKIFAEMMRLEYSCICEEEKITVPLGCAACQRWQRLNNYELHAALGLTPWDWPAVLVPDIDKADDRAGLDAQQRYRALKVALNHSKLAIVR